MKYSPGPVAGGTGTTIVASLPKLGKAVTVSPGTHRAKWSLKEAGFPDTRPFKDELPSMQTNVKGVVSTVAALTGWHSQKNAANGTCRSVSQKTDKKASSSLTRKYRNWAYVTGSPDDAR